MTPSVTGQVHRSDLIHGADHQLVPSDTFEVKDTIGRLPGHPRRPVRGTSTI